MTNYCTPADLRTQIENDATTGSSSDAALRILIGACSTAIDRFFNRADGFVAGAQATARLYAGDATPILYIADCVSISSVAVKESPTDSTYTAWTTSDWIGFSGHPDYPDFNRLPYSAIMVDPGGSYDVFTSGKVTGLRGFRPSSSVGRAVPTVQVTARWGYALETPQDIKALTIALAARMFKQGQSSWVDTLASAELGQMIYNDSNPEIKMILQNSRYMRPALGDTR